ncbi:MAG TPA: cyclic nucleotide-binding domain-containing protein [Bdellovibrionota bacterium]|jgi:CRP-like cAMP-binding protein
MSASSLFYIAQIGYLLTLVSYGVRNVAWLRSIAIAASSAAIYYSFVVADEPLWIPILWHALFVLMNGVHLVLSRWRSRDVKLDALEDFLAKTVLMNFPPAEVKSFSSLAGEGELPSGSQMIRAGTSIQHLFCILKGKVDVLAQGKKVAELGPGRFVGEMSLLTRSATRADVVAAADLKLLVWTHENIEKWVNSDASRLGLLQTALGTQVVEELLRQQSLSADGQTKGAG